MATQTQRPAPDTAVNTEYRLTDNRNALEGTIFLTGTQALVRLLIMQKRHDQAAGLNTAGFVSGYRGSPLASVDMELWRAKADLEQHAIQFLPGVNEDLAATAIMGTQQVSLDSEKTVDGVFGMWYGKGPGVDRAGDALRHGNAAGASQHGGVLLIVGDDHAATSSSIPNASDLSLIGWGIPVIHPASVEEYVDFGLWGWAASRTSSTWVAFKAISEVVESGRTISANVLPTFITPELSSPVGALEYRTSDFLTAAIEARLAAKLDALRAFARANPLDRMVIDAPQAKVGVVTVGKAHHDVMEILQRSGEDDLSLKERGIRIYKVGLTYPLEFDGLDRFLLGLEHVLVVEEKVSVVEQQIKDRIFNRPIRPTVCGKTHIDGKPLISPLGQLRPASLAPSLNQWFEAVAPGLMVIDLSKFTRVEALSNAADTMRRLPYFCSGCPHNSSTKVPEGSTALAGVGCHYMASWMHRRTGGLTHMGGEGADWIGKAGFTKTTHVFQNMGEGTYFHSGYMAIRQAIAAGVNITYKILFNDAVAMTGGQAVDGTLTVPQICRQMESEGARKIVVVTDQPALYAGLVLGHNIRIHHRRDLDLVQRELREVKGVTVLIYEQTCAAEKRRRRKRNAFPDPPKLVFINPSVCEGCGDCGIQSNCLSIAPLETEYGRKRQIDYSTCNKDYSCIDGFCPSFVSVIGGRLRKGPSMSIDEDRLVAKLASVPPPHIGQIDDTYDLMVAGVGGTGIITIGALIAMAAHLEGKKASVLDFTALAQKGGSVISHIRLSPATRELHSVRIEWQRANAVLVSDLVVGVLPDVLGTMKAGYTNVVANNFIQTLAEFTQQPDIKTNGNELLAKVTHAAGIDHVHAIDASGISRLVMGDTISANILLMGFAWQKGWIPLSLRSIERAIELNGVSAETNKRAFACGRVVAHDAAWVDALAKSSDQAIQLPTSDLLDQMIESRSEQLRRYQNQTYAAAYRNFVSNVREKENKILRNGEPLLLTEAVARYLYKIMAYRDEYEVARLHSDPDFVRMIDKKFEGDYKLKFNLAPPLLARRNSRGELIKREYGSWAFSAFRLLAQFKMLRGTRFDIFGYSQERKKERDLINEYKGMVESVLHTLHPANHAIAVKIASLPDRIRGYGHVKVRHLEDYEHEKQRLFTKLAPLGPSQVTNNLKPV